MRINLDRRFWIAIGVIALLVGYGPVSDEITILTANSQVKQLAVDAGMSRKGTLAFLKANPRIVESDEIKSLCGAQDDTIEQGCWVASNDGAEHIYIRKFTDKRLMTEETVTAAHEMLHSEYDKLDGSTKNKINKSLESKYQSLSDSELSKRIDRYRKIEPNDIDNELHSILATEQESLPRDLEEYYAQYFTDRKAVIGAHNQVSVAFSDAGLYLDKLSADIDKDIQSADLIYAKHVRAANNGDEYYADLFYGQYENAYRQYQWDVDAYKIWAQDYNDPTALFNGEKVSAPTVYQQK